MPTTARLLKSVAVLITGAALGVACAGEKPVTHPASPADHLPLETNGRWIWSKPDIEELLKNKQITQADANKTLAADGSVCASQAGETPVQTAVCESEFVFECVDLPQAALTGCTTSVRGPSCSAKDTDAITRIQQAAFVNCMLEIGWDRHRAGKQ